MTEPPPRSVMVGGMLMLAASWALTWLAAVLLTDIDVPNALSYSRDCQVLKNGTVGSMWK